MEEKLNKVMVHLTASLKILKKRDTEDWNEMVVEILGEGLDNLIIANTLFEKERKKTHSKARKNLLWDIEEILIKDIHEDSKKTLRKRLEEFLIENKN